MDNAKTQKIFIDEKKQNIVFISFCATALILSIIMLFLPIISYVLADGDLARTASPISFAAMLNDSYLVETGAAFIMLGAFIVWFAFTLAVFVFGIRAVISVFSDKKALPKETKRAIMCMTFLLCALFMIAVIATVISKINLGSWNIIVNLPLYITVVVIDLIFAVVYGFAKPSRSDGKGNDERSVEYEKCKRTSMFARLELLLFAIVTSVVSVMAMLSNLLTIDVIVEKTEEIYSTIKVSGWQFLTDDNIFKDGGYMVRFFLFAMLLIVLSMVFLSLVSFLGRSSLFYKINLYSIGFSSVSCLLVGLFGKYYQIVDAMNKNYVLSYTEDYLGAFEEIIPQYVLEVKSTAWYFFLGVLGVLAVLLLRHPYTRGIGAENKMASLSDESTIKISGGNLKVAQDEEEAGAFAHSMQVASAMSPSDPSSVVGDPCPAFTEIDMKLPSFEEELAKKREALFEAPTLPKLVQFIVDYARDSRLHLSYTPEDIATFVAGLGTTRLSILQGMSGTGKTSLPKIFAEALMSVCDIVEVESSWRDKSELLGYYNEFSKTYTPKKFTQALYRARLNSEVLTFIVLDEMNLSRIEYYFSDFLSLMENEEDKREIKLLNVGLKRIEGNKVVSYRGLVGGHTIKIPKNVWFVGTANRDESTFEISDKVYDRANTMNFNKRAPKVTYHNEPIPQRYISPDVLTRLFDEAKLNVNFNIDSYSAIAEVEKLLAPYNISFGNRVATQIESFVSIYCSCFTMTESVLHNAVETILLSKVVSKLELKSIDDKEQLAAEFEKLKFYKCSEFIMNINEV
ncbi:MAG: hypothetical protein J6Q78_03550 [Clostridia bacterium]|nr:hypothetical protein [Clostridia bacterium]